MSDLMQKGAAFLASRRKQSLSREITYRRGSQGATALSTRGRSPFEVTDKDGVFQRIETRDEIIEVSELAGFGEPQRGDLIDDGTHTLEVCPPAPGISQWSWSSPFRTSYRIHTRAVPST
jgi:hypothetical protein